MDPTGLFWDSYYQRMKGSVDFEFTKDDLKQAAELGFTKKEQLAVFGDIREYMKNNPDLKNGTSIFVFEGLGDYEGGKNEYHEKGHFGAMILITRDQKITYMTPNASSLPDTDTKTIDDGIYVGIQWRHNGAYDAIQVRNLDSDLSEDIPVNNDDITTADGVNIHAAGDGYGNKPWSTACITIRTSDYLEFLGETGMVDTKAYKISDVSEITYTQLSTIIKQVPDDYRNTKVKVGNVVVDRQHLDPQDLPYNIE